MSMRFGGHRRASARCVSLVALVMWAVGLATAVGAEGGASKPSTVRIVLGGDVMLDGGPGHALSHGKDPFAGVASVLKDADLAVCNLECVVAKRGRHQVLKPYTFKAEPECVPVLARYFAAVCLANNHSCDFGLEGLCEELGLLEKARIGHFGAGRDREEAYRPWIVERNGLRVALLGYNDFPPRSFEAGKGRPGIAWLTSAEAVAGVKAARAVHHADVVIVLPHWGYELKPLPDESQKSLARNLIDAGADAVIGGHPHVTQTTERYKGRPIVYSLGNLVFDYYPGDPLVWSGWVVRLTFSRTAPAALEMFVVELDPAGIPHLTK